MDIGKLHPLAKTAALLKLIFGLAGEADHDIGGDGDIGNRPSNHGHCPLIFCHRVGPPHPPQHAVAAALKREVKVTAQPPAVPERDEPRGEVLRLEGGEANPLHIALGEDAPDEGLKALPIGSDPGAGEYNLPVAHGHPGLDLTDHIGKGHASLPASNQGHDAVGAELVAALLNLDHAAGARGGRLTARGRRGPLL